MGKQKLTLQLLRCISYTSHRPSTHNLLHPTPSFLPSSSSPTRSSSITTPSTLFQCRRFYSSSNQKSLEEAESQEEKEKLARRAQLMERIMEMGSDKKIGEQYLHCTVYDQAGEVDDSIHKMKKAEICTKYEIHPRDLRKLDISSNSPKAGEYRGRPTSTTSTILARPKVLLVNVVYARAIITAGEVILFDPSEEYRNRDLHQSKGRKDKDRPTEELHELFKRSLEGKLRIGGGVGTMNGNGSGNGGEPYEHRALEAILLTLTSIYEAELSLLIGRTRQLIHDLGEDISREELKDLLELRTAVSGFKGRVEGGREAVEKLLSDDDDLAASYLTAKATNKPRSPEDHEEFELLLENYSQRLESIINDIANAMSEVQSTQNVVELLLDSSRNMLLVLDLRMSIITLGLTFATVGAGIFGMNMINSYEDSHPAFLVTTGSLAAISVLTMLIGLRVLRSVSKVGLDGVKGMSFRHQIGKEGMKAMRAVRGSG